MSMSGRLKATLVSIGAAITMLLAVQAPAALAYNPINPVDAGQTVVLNGHNLTVAKLVAIARYGAKVQLSPDARQRSLNAYYLLLEGARENVPIYYFNRGTGAGRQQVIFSGDPLSPANKALISQTELTAFRTGKQFGLGPEVNDEEILRAMMAVRANTMTFEAASPQLTNMLLALLNNDITPVVFSRGSPGEGDLPQMYQVAAAMVGVGDVYYHGVRMTASQALSQAGLQPLQPFGYDDGALASTNAYTVGQAALLANDGQHMLNWADLIYAMDLEAMNSSVTPLSAPVQAARPFRWLNADAARVMDMIRGSYLFNLDQLSSTHVPFRIIQDPESLRASSQRDGSAWEVWGHLRSELSVQMNSSDHNPVTAVGWKPSDSPELSTPWFMQYYVHGGPDNANCVGQGCHHGYILSNANWEPINVDNQIEGLTNAVANMATAIDQRIQRFSNTFFTVISPSDVLTPTQLSNAAPGNNDYNVADLMAEIQTLQNPVPAQGNAIIQNVEDLQAEGRIKVARARLAVDDSMYLLGEDLLNATFWMNVRQAQGQKLGLNRSFGAAPTAAWNAFRQVVPWQEDPNLRPLGFPATQLAYDFLVANPASLFYPPAVNPPLFGSQAFVSKAKLHAAVRAARARTFAFRSTRARRLHSFLAGQAFQATISRKH
jgi:histidine ammonia-lyase